MQVALCGRDARMPQIVENAAVEAPAASRARSTGRRSAKPVETTPEAVGEHVVLAMGEVAALGQAGARGLVGKGNLTRPQGPRRGRLHAAADGATDDRLAPLEVDVVPPQGHECAAA